MSHKNNTRMRPPAARIRRFFALEPPKPRQVAADTAVSLFVLAAATLLGSLFYWLGFSNSNVMMAYLLGVLVIAVATSHLWYSLISAIAAVYLFNYFFIMPRFSLNAYEPGYPVTFVVMFLTAFITGTLAARLKNAAREKEEAAVLAENERMRSTLLRAISHDLRTPLTSISGNASNLLANDAVFDDATRRRLYADIYEDSLWLINLVENLLASTRFENGDPRLQLSAELMEDIIAEAVRHIRPEELRHSIVVESPGELLMVRADTRLIVQVLVNLIDNAVKYTPPGSTIRITSAAADGMVSVSVADDGPGIAPEDKERLFDMFYVGHKSPSDGRRSLGLGLALCRSIVLAHGGTITVADNIPHGAVFTFTLPAEEVPIHG